MKFISKLSKTAIVMIASLAGLFVVLLLAGLLVIHFLYSFEEPLRYTLGLSLGIISSMIKVILLNKSIARTLDMEGKTVQLYATLQVFLRYAVTIIVVVLAILFPERIGVFGTIAGILSLQLSSYVTHFILKRREDWV